MTLRTIPTKPFSDQRPGTSGLRKPVRVFQQPGYVENFAQCIFDAMKKDTASAHWVLGGDGRYFSREAIRCILKIAAANSVSRMLVGQGGILSTPAASCIIRQHKLRGGILLTASHNPGGPDGDFGIKVNDSNGGPTTAEVTEAIYKLSKGITRYAIIDAPDVKLDVLGITRVGDMVVEIIDPVADYAALMQQLFDFGRIRELISTSRFRMRFDAMHAVSGPYAHDIFERRLGAPAGTVVHGLPREDFGGGHPDPNPTHAHELVELLNGPDAPHFGAAADGDGDRNLILGRRFFVNPSDSLAILTANAALIPAYRDGLAGVARSMPTSAAVDAVAEALGIPCFETPTGWKFFGTLLDEGLVTLCGEESFGTGSNHIREKDGLWAVLFWLNLLAVRQLSVQQIVREHWRRFGRHYYERHDYEGVAVELANDVFNRFCKRLPSFTGRKTTAGEIIAADEFRYVDPVDHCVADHQGIRVIFDGGARIVLRISGTGTAGATMRVYFERFSANASRSPNTMLAPLIATADELISLRKGLSRAQPSVVT